MLLCISKPTHATLALLPRGQILVRWPDDYSLQGARRVTITVPYCPLLSMVPWYPRRIHTMDRYIQYHTYIQYIRYIVIQSRTGSPDDWWLTRDWLTPLCALLISMRIIFGGRSLSFSLCSPSWKRINWHQEEKREGKRQTRSTKVVSRLIPIIVESDRKQTDTTQPSLPS